MVDLLERVRAFVLANKAANASRSQARVTLTLQYCDRFLGTALSTLHLDHPLWWRRYCEAVDEVRFDTASWALLLGSIRDDPPASSHTDPWTQHVSRRDCNAVFKGRSPRQHQQRRQIMPDDIRALIPKDRFGKEPCLRHLIGLPCGNRPGCCAQAYRTHDWEGPALPRRLEDWAKRHFAHQLLQQE